MTLRIISGERRGALLRAPEGQDTRPLRDRIRQALFNVIRNDVPESVVLDAFAGSGAVGLEALSNGARHCTFVDPSPGAIDCIRSNIRKLRYEDRTLVVRGMSPRSLQTAGPDAAPFHILFLMPPYHSGLCKAVLEEPAVRRRCRADALAVCEIHEKEKLAPPGGWQLLQERLYGITRLVFLRGEEPAGADGPAQAPVTSPPR